MRVGGRRKGMMMMMMRRRRRRRKMAVKEEAMSLIEAEGKKKKGRFKKAGRTVLQGVRAIDGLKSIRLSIINVPFRRRLQTFCTALWLFMIPCGTLAMWCITVLALLWPLTCVPTALYLLFIFSWDKR